MSNEDIFTEMKKMYGKESPEVKDYDGNWNNSIEEEMNSQYLKEKKNIAKEGF